MHVIHIWSGFLLDLALGDPAWFPHPVRGIGRLISCLEKVIRRLGLGPRGLRAAGVVLAAVTVGTTYFVTRLVLQGAEAIGPAVFQVASVLVIYFTLATRCLGQEARQIYRVLARDDVALAREKLSYIVGRDTGKLDKPEIVRAVVETVAENTVDGIVSPLCYLFLGGPALGMAYKAVNTLDSMVGYLNEEYKDLGWASAKLDDLANWIPARLTALLMVFAGACWGQQAGRGLAILKRDRRNHKSPNGGYPEAAMAGVLGVRIGGTNYYFGQPVYKPTIGDPHKPLDQEDIIKAVRIMVTTAVFCVMLLSFAVLL